MSIEVVVERFIIEELLLGSDEVKLEPRQPLYTSGVLDSLALLRLIMFLEERYGVTIEDGQVVPENFDSLERIRGFVERQRGDARPAR